jgi:hypothetical protein
MGFGLFGATPTAYLQDARQWIESALDRSL